MTDGKLTRHDAAYVARLARIDLTDEELDLYAGQLAVVLDHAAQVAALDTTGVEPTAHPLPLQNVLLDGFNGSPVSGDGDTEVTLDIDMAICMAPGLSNIIVYEGNPFNGNAPNDTLNQMAVDNKAKQLSLREIDGAYFEQMVEKNCRPLMTRFFPEIKSLDDAKL